jgi:hypothetical protein
MRKSGSEMYFAKYSSDPDLLTRIYYHMISK